MALKLNFQLVVGWNNKGISYDYLKKHEEAIECYSKALDIDPKYVEAWSNKGLSLFYLGRYEEAIECYNKALELNPQLAVVWNNMGNALINIERINEAQKAFEKAFEIDPSFVIPTSFTPTHTPTPEIGIPGFDLKNMVFGFLLIGIIVTMLLLGKKLIGKL